MLVMYHQYSYGNITLFVLNKNNSGYIMYTVQNFVQQEIIIALDFLLCTFCVSSMTFFGNYITFLYPLQLAPRSNIISSPSMTAGDS